MAEAQPFHVLWSDTAQQGLSEIIEYIAQDSVDETLAIMRTLETKAA